MSPDWIFMATAPPPAGADDDIGMVLIEFDLGDVNGTVEIIVGQGRIQDLVAVALEIGRLAAAWGGLPAVEEEEFHDSIVLAYLFLFCT